MAEREKTGELRELELLEALAENPEARQVDLATRLGVAVGTVNWLLKRLIAKGFVKVKRIGRWKWRYIVTPRGFAEKTKLTRRYVRYSMRLYRQIRQEARQLLNTVAKRGYGRVRLEGNPDSDLLDICSLTCLEQKIAVDNSREPAGQDEIPVLRLVGRELIIEWPEEKEDG